MNYFSENLYTVLGFIAGVILFYQGINGLISGELHIGGRGISSGVTFTPPESIYYSIVFILSGCFSTYLLIRSILDYKRDRK